MGQMSLVSAASLRLLLAITTLLLLRPVYALSVKGTVLVIAKDLTTSNSATSGLRGYGIPYETFFTSTSSNLPALSSSADSGNYGAIVILDEVLSAAQLATIQTYQQNYGVRLARLNAQPGADSGTAYAIAGAGCCDTGVEQLVSLTNTTGFPGAGLKTTATVSSANLWHAPAVVTNTSTTWPIATFAPAGSFKNSTVAAVINDNGSRQQLLWFMPFDTTWSPTSNFLMHSWIQWVTRGLYTGYRRINLNTQIDDLFLITELFKPAGSSFRIRTDDLDAHVSWTTEINAKMPTGSTYFIELGHNGNGNIEGATPNTQDSYHDRICKPGPVEYADQPDETPAIEEYQKPIGTGVDLWPLDYKNYTFTTECTEYDELENWFTDDENLNAFSHLSHTFTHEDLNNATYNDASREIAYNQAWLKQVGISAATRFSSKGLIPPAITGLHNGDAIKAWMDNGITGVVGDNTRQKLLNKQNEYWPLMTNVADNGYAGMPIIPRWSTNMYYNCDTIACDLALYQNVSAPKGTWEQLVADTQSTNVRNLLALRRDPYMFHQANLRQTDIETSTVGGVSKRWSLLMIWTETVVQELVRLTTWPIITLKHDDMVQAFVDRMTRDQCSPSITYNYGNSTTGRTITGVTLSAGVASCSAKIPITFPGTVKATGSATKEQVGSDPLTLWQTYNGNAVTFELTTPIPV